MPVLEEESQELQKIEKPEFSNQITRDTADKLAEVFDEDGKRILEELGLEKEYVTLASKLMSKNIAEIVTVIGVMKIREGDKEFNEDLKKGKNSVIFSILKETILESGLLYIGFTQTQVDSYLGDETTIRRPIDIKAILKLINMKEEGTLEPFEKWELLRFDTISSISRISEPMLNNLNKKLPKINFFKEEYNMIIEMDDIVNCDLYPNKIPKINENLKGEDLDLFFQGKLLYSDDFSAAINKLTQKLNLLKILGLDVSFGMIHKIYMDNNENRLKSLESGIDKIISMRDDLFKFRDFGFTLEWENIPKFNEEFIDSQIAHIISLLPKLKELTKYKGEETIKIRISLDDIISASGKLSEEMLDKLIEKKAIFNLFFYTINQKTLSLKHIVDLEYMVTDEKALERYVKLKHAGVVIANFQLESSKKILTEFSDPILDDACRLSNMGIRIKIDEIAALPPMNYQDLETIFTHEEDIKTWLGTDKVVENNGNRPVAASISHNYRTSAFERNGSELGNLNRLSKICSSALFPEFAKRYESFQLGNLDLKLELINGLLEKYIEDPETLYELLEKLGDSDKNKTIKKNFIESLIDDSKAYYNLPEITSDELFIAKQLAGNTGDIPDAIVFLEDLGYDTTRNSGAYFACLRRLKDDNAWHEYEYAEYLYDTADIDGNGLTDDNWIELLGLHALVDLDEGMHKELKNNLAKIIPQNDIDNKNFMLAKLREMLDKLLDSGLEALSREEKMIIDIIHKNGAGNLSYLEGIANFIYQLIKVFQSDKTVAKTIKELKTGIKDIGDILARKGWDDADIIDFFNIGADILESAPSLYSTYLDLFKELSPKQLKDFYKNMYPYYHIELVLRQEIDKDGNFSYNSRELVSLRKNIKNLIENLKENKKPSNILKKEQDRIQSSIEKQFQLRFGIKKIPDPITVDHMKSIKNYTLYLANIKGLDDEKETLIGFFLALKLNEVWNDFREGKNINVGEYMMDGKVEFLNHYINERKKKSINLDNLDIEENFEEFSKHLQEETVAQYVGDVDDIDIRLLSIQSNIIELLDEDIYTGDDKVILNLLNAFGKNVGKALAMKFRELDGKGKMGETDKIIIEELGKNLSIEDWSVEKVKGLQQTLKSISPITNFVQKIRNIGIDGEVGNLKNAQIPSEEIIAIFQKLGENFSSESGVRGISNDVQYLRIMISKGKHKLTNEEKEIVTNYLDDTEAHILKLESTKDNIEKLFDNMYQQLKNTENNILKDRLDSLKEIVYQSVGGKKLIITKMNNDLDTVITNIRACLSCQKKECNNDTNLTFGDNNRFFMTSYSGNMEKSFSDQLVTLLETNQGPMFVMDLMYGERVPDVFLAHVLCIFKKLRTLGTEKISIFIPSSAARGCHLTEENMKKSLEEDLGKNFSITKEEKLEITIGKSASGDSYHEFSGGSCRGTGEREVKGFVVTLVE